MHRDDEEATMSDTDPAAFRAQIDTVFDVDHDSGAVPLRLAEVADERSGGGFEQFSLFFHGPPDRLLPQGSYSFRRDGFAALELFIVPVLGSNHERIVYQACLSRPVPRG